MKLVHPLSGFEYDVEKIAKRFIEYPHQGRSYDWWQPSSRPPWREDVWLGENKVMMTRSFECKEEHPVYLLSLEIELAVWRYLYEEKCAS